MYLLAIAAQGNGEMGGMGRVHIWAAIAITAGTEKGVLFVFSTKIFLREEKI